MKTKTLCKLVIAGCLLAMSAGGAWAEPQPEPLVLKTGDDGAPSPMGAWIDTFGQCAWILSGYNTNVTCEEPILQGQTPVLPFPGSGPVGCEDGSSYVGGVNQDQVDCTDLDAEGVFEPDPEYRVYVGPNPYPPTGEGTGYGRTLVAEDTCAPVFDATWWGTYDNGLSYDITGLAAGSYRMSVYVMDGNGGQCSQKIEVAVDGATTTPGQAVGDDAAGVYQQYLVDVAANETITVTHTCVAMPSSGAGHIVAQGVFFDLSDTTAGDYCGFSVCPDGQDRVTNGNWIGLVGADGALLFDRNNPTTGADASDGDVLKLNFGSDPPTVTPTSTDAKTYFWTTPASAEECGTAMAYTWDLDTTGDPKEGITLENPGGCLVADAVRPASTYDDAGERGFNPNLRFDIDIPPGDYWLTIYAVDFDNENQKPSPEECRQQDIQIYPYREFGDPLFGTVDAVGSGLFPGGIYVRYALQGGLNGAKVSLQISSPNCVNAILSGIFLDPYERAECAGGDLPFCSQTPGGWGAPPHGTNPGWALAENAGAILPITIGDGLANKCDDDDTKTFSSATEVEDFLPIGGKPNTFCSKKGPGVFAGQLLAAKINVAFSDDGILTKPKDPPEPANTGLGDLILQSDGCELGDLSIDSGLNELTVDKFIELADQAISGGDTGGVKISAISDALAIVNESFTDCLINAGIESKCLVEPYTDTTAYTTP